MRMYRLESNDSTDGKEVVTVKDRESGRIIWSKTRALTEDEIVSTVLDSHQLPRFTLHRPRQSVTTSTSKSSPPWPQYLVIRSPTFPDGQCIPLIDVDDVKAKGKAKEEDQDSLKFNLSIPTQTTARSNRVRSSRPAQLNLASHSTLSINDDEEDDPLTPTTAKPNPSKPVKQLRPKSATYRVDMTPSLSQDSSTSSASDRSTSSAITDNSLTSKDPLSSSTPPSVHPHVHAQEASFRLQPSLPFSLLAERERAAPSGFGKRVFGKLRSLIVEEGKTWSCIWEKLGRGPNASENDKDEEVIMYFEEDPPSLFPSPMKGTLSLSEELVDRSGYEPSFWVTVGMAWMECQGEREGWREGRGGD